jgi:TPR repeat protein
MGRSSFIHAQSQSDHPHLTNRCRQPLAALRHQSNYENTSISISARSRQRRLSSFSLDGNLVSQIPRGLHQPVLLRRDCRPRRERTGRPCHCHRPGPARGNSVFERPYRIQGHHSRRRSRRFRSNACLPHSLRPGDAHQNGRGGSRRRQRRPAVEAVGYHCDRHDTHASQVSSDANHQTRRCSEPLAVPRSSFRWLPYSTRSHARPRQRSLILFSLGLCMHRPVAFLIFLAITCPTARCDEMSPVPSIHTHGLDLSNAERLRFEQKAADGDASAAMRLWEYYAIELHDSRAADPWLCRAAELGDATAQWNLGYSIKEHLGLSSPRLPKCARQFGDTPKAAVKRLLEASARSVGSACFELASAYEDGYFGARNRVKARKYFAQGANLNDDSCWEKLADYYHRGLGGPRDEAEAYFWISLYARCWSPANIIGERAWKTRDDIAQQLSPAARESAWQRIDAFIAKTTAIDVPPESAGKSSDPSRPFLLELQAREDEHRQRLKVR